ncbi:MAG: 50S ribosomal protein L7/L12 [Bacillales bacterium]|jgi:large subunit ribosomal protein L7/L12|nr:50S ribosomal protein L7/L12 [Bacillales bacterium]
MAKLTKEEIVASLKEFTILELNELVHAVEEEFGVTAVAVAGPAAGPVEEATGPAAPTTGTVILKSAGQSKVPVIKAVQSITGLSLMDAKKLVDGAPVEIKKDVPLTEADEIKAKLVEAGAEVEIK